MSQGVYIHGDPSDGRCEGCKSEARDAEREVNSEAIALLKRCHSRREQEYYPIDALWSDMDAFLEKVK